MLETLRAYGAERLAEAGESETLAAATPPGAWHWPRRPPPTTARPWLRRVEADYDNLRAALDRAVAGRDVETALRLAAALAWFWWTTHTIEGRRDGRGAGPGRRAAANPLPWPERSRRRRCSRCR